MIVSQESLVELSRVRKLAGAGPLRRRRIPRQQYPRRLEVEYARELVELAVEEVRRSVEPLLRELPALLESAARAREDSAARTVAEFRVVVENPRGSVRRWYDHDGSEGETVMVHDYGYLVGYRGADGEEVDVYLGPVAEPEWVFVVHQRRKDDWVTYDEDKVMLGWESADAARVAYLAQYDDPRFFGGMSVFTLEDFRRSLEARGGRKIVHLDADEGRYARRLVEAARDRVKTNLPKVEELAKKFADRTSSYHRRQLGNQVRAALGIDVLIRDRGLSAKLEHFASENVSLIKSIQNELHDRVEKIVTRAIVEGRPRAQVTKEIEERFGVGKSHARLIARDQMGKLYGQINASRQKELGVRRFIWRTVGDERVRSEHSDYEAESEKEPFYFDDPPNGELPGVPIQCRCTAEPVFDDLLEEDKKKPEEEGDVQAALPPGYTGLADLEEEFGVNAKGMRAILRKANIQKPDVGWGWKPDDPELEKIKKLLAEKTQRRRKDPPREPERKPEPEKKPEPPKPEPPKPEEPKRPEPEKLKKVPDKAPPAVRRVTDDRSQYAKMRLGDIDLNRQITPTPSAWSAPEDLMPRRVVPREVISPDAQKAVRAHHNQVLDAYGMPFKYRGRVGRGRSAYSEGYLREVVSVESKADMGNADAWHNSTSGEVRMADKIARQYDGFVKEREAGLDHAREMAKLAVEAKKPDHYYAAQRWRELKNQVEAYHVVNHESIHGRGPRVPYRGVGVVVEEVTTELSARRVTRDVLGVSLEEATNWTYLQRMEMGGGGGGHQIGSKDGAYRWFIDPLVRDLHALGVGGTYEEAYQKLEDASIRFKKEKKKVTTPEQMVSRLVSGLDVDAAISRTGGVPDESTRAAMRDKVTKTLTQTAERAKR